MATQPGRGCTSPRPRSATCGWTGVDALILETHQLDQALAALAALAGSPGLPVLASLYRWPDPIRDAARTLADAGAVALGANCLNGMTPAVRIARRLSHALLLGSRVVRHGWCPVCRCRDRVCALSRTLVRAAVHQGFRPGVRDARHRSSSSARSRSCATSG